MKPFDRPLDDDVQDELDRLDAALRGDAAADPALSALVADVVATRPTLDAGARERLEDRIRVASDGAGARPAEPRGPRGFGGRRWRLAFALGAAVVVAVPVAGVVLRDGTPEVTSVSDNRSGDRVAESRDPSLPKEQSPSGDVTLDRARPESTPSTGRGSASGSSSSGGLAEDRSVVREARQVVRVASSGIAAASRKVAQVVADQGGYVGASSVSETASSPRAVFEVVVPSDRLEATITAIGRVGKPVELERTTSDVTDERASIDDRLRDQRADRASVRLQLARTTDASTRAAKRRELRLLSSRIARLEGEQRALREDVSTARLSLELTADRDGATRPTAADDRWGLSTAWHDAGRVLEVLGGIALLVAAILVPLAVAVGLLAVGIRRLTSARKNRTIDDA